jgi:hypothetical protein
MRRGAQPDHLTSFGKTGEVALPPHDDVVLCLTTENEFMRRTFKNDRSTIVKLRTHLHTVKHALQTLHTKGVGGSENDTSEEQHPCLVSQLNNLDRVTLDWSRCCETLHGETRELYQQHVKHAKELEASKALRAAHEATIFSLKTSSRDHFYISTSLSGRQCRSSHRVMSSNSRLLPRLQR